MVDDPDAMWRPGYTGPVVYPHVEAPPARTSRRRRRSAFVLAGAVAFIAVAVAVAVATVARPSGDEARSPASPAMARIPTGSRERWSVTLDAAAVPTVSGSADTIVALTAGELPRVIAIDVTSGAQRWSVGPPAGRVDAIDLLGDVAVVTSVDRSGVRTLSGLDLASGRIRWVLADEVDARIAIDEGQVVVVRPTGGSSSVRSVQWIDPATGEVESEIDGGDITLWRSGAQRRAGDRIEVFDRRPFRSRASVDLAALGLAGQQGVRAVATAGGVVIATRTAVMLVDDGRVVSTIGLTPLPAGRERVGLQTLDDAGLLVAVEQGDGLVVISTDGGVLRELWTESAWLIDWRVDAERRLLAIAQVTGSVVSMPPQVVDAATGGTLWNGPAAVQQSSPLRTFGANGFIAVDASRAGADAPAVVGYDLERAELWRRPLEPGSDFTLVDGGLVTISRDVAADATTLTYYS